MDADIIIFPHSKIAGAEDARGDDGPRSCDLCVHFLSGVSGEYCRALNEDLFSLYEAEDCSLYES
jgi:hypothetical protein